MTMLKLPKNMAEFAEMVHWKEIKSTAKALQEEAMKEAAEIKKKIEAAKDKPKDDTKQ
jgi:hypothetical protein